MIVQNDNGGLYFIVGMLLVAVIGIGFLFLNDNADGPNIISKTERTIERTVEKPSEKSSTSFSLAVDEDGVTATTTDNN